MAAFTSVAQRGEGSEGNARQLGSGHKRFRVLSDSQAVCAVLTKGKSGARSLLPVINKFNSLQLATRTYAPIGFVSSEENTADRPSRRARFARQWPSQKRRRQRA